MADGLKVALGQDRMTPALFRPPAEPKPTPVQQAQEKLTGIEQRIGETQREAGQFQATQAEFGARQKAAEAKKGAELVKAESEAISGSQAYQDLEQVSRQAAQERFAPSQRTMQENAALFGLISVIGFAIGSGGKGNAMQAMSAMNGMLEGVQKGDMQRYTREKDVFNTNLRALQQKSQLLATEVKRITELAARDREEARLQFASLQANENADFIRQYADKFGLPATVKYLEQLEKAAQRTLQMAEQAEYREQSRIDAEKRRLDSERALALYREGLRRETLLMRPPSPARPGAPVRVTGPDGKETQIIPTYDQSGMMVLPEGYTLSATQRAGQYAQIFANRMYGNILGASADIANIVQLPASSELPIFSGLLESDPQKILQSIARFGAAEITEDQARLFQQVSTQLGAALARLEGQGLASAGSQANIRAFNAMRPVAGDKAINMAMYIARVKQEIETGIRVHQTMHGATAEQRQQSQKELEKINRLIPFTVDDVMRIARGDKSAALSDRMQRILQQPLVATQLQQPAGPSAVAPSAATAASQPTHTLRGRPIVVRDGKWVFQDTGEEAK